MLAEFDGVHSEDLAGTAVTVARKAPNPPPDDRPHDDDVITVREVHVRGQRRINYLIEGLPYFADVRDEDAGLIPTESFYPFVPLVINPRSERLDAVSQTTTQDATETTINTVEDQREDARQAAQSLSGR